MEENWGTGIFGEKDIEEKRGTIIRTRGIILLTTIQN